MTRSLVVAVAISLAASSAATAKTVRITNFEFKPSTITIRKGQSVRFTNLDAVPHDVVPDMGAKFTGCHKMAKGQSATVRFDTPGDQHFMCEIHPGMKGLVKVIR